MLLELPEGLVVFYDVASPHGGVLRPRAHPWVHVAPAALREVSWYRRVPRPAVLVGLSVSVFGTNVFNEERSCPMLHSVRFSLLWLVPRSLCSEPQELGWRMTRCS